MIRPHPGGNKTCTSLLKGWQTNAYKIPSSHKAGAKEDIKRQTSAAADDALFFRRRGLRTF